MTRLLPHEDTFASVDQAEMFVAVPTPPDPRGGLAVAGTKIIHALSSRYFGPSGVSLALHVLAFAVVMSVVRPHQPATPPAPASFAVVFEAPVSTIPVAESRIAMVMPIYAVLAVSPLGYAPPRPKHAVAAPVRTSRIPGVGAVSEAHAAPALPAQVAAPVKDVENATAIGALESRISQAVNAAKFYPPAARQLHRQGRAAISFAYRDGGAMQVVLAQTSRIEMLDNAALEAVRRAHYPMPPAGLAGMTLHLRLWVNFSLVTTD